MNSFYSGIKIDSNKSHLINHSNATHVSAKSHE